MREYVGNLATLNEVGVGTSASVERPIWFCTWITFYCAKAALPKAAPAAIRRTDGTCAWDSYEN